MYVDHATQVM